MMQAERSESAVFTSRDCEGAALKNRSDRINHEPRVPVQVRFVKALLLSFRPLIVSAHGIAKPALNSKLASFFRFAFSRPKRRSLQLPFPLSPPDGKRELYGT